MDLIEPVVIGDAELLSSSVLEDDYPQWTSGTAYSIGDRVISTTTHRVYEALAASTGVDPTTDDGTYWYDVEATDRWKPFDQQSYQQIADDSAAIFYKLLMPNPAVGGSTTVDAIGLFGLQPSPGHTVKILIRDTDQTTIIYNQTFSIEARELVVDGLPAQSGGVIEVTIDQTGSSFPRRVSEIVPGRVRNLGKTLDDTVLSMVSYSSVDTDVFGNRVLIKRGFSRRVDFRFSADPTEGRTVARLLERLDAVPCIYYAGLNVATYGEIIYGIHREWNIPLTAGAGVAVLEVESV